MTLFPVGPAACIGSVVFVPEHAHRREPLAARRARPHHSRHRGVRRRPSGGAALCQKPHARLPLALRGGGARGEGERGAVEGRGVRLLQGGGGENADNIQNI